MEKAGKPSWLVKWSVDHPKLVLVLTLLVTIGFATQLPKVRTDTDPKNMLPASSDVRVYTDQVEKWFSLHKDTIVLGVVNEKGVLNPQTLGAVARLTDGMLGIEGVVSQDVDGLTTVSNVVLEGGTLAVRPPMTQVPQTADEVEAVRTALYDNPMFVDRFISKDGTTTAIYAPLEPGANGKEVAERIRGLLAKETGPERYYIAGDPVVRDTFGSQMFLLMALFSPIAGMIMMVALLVMFRNLALAFTVMGVAMISVAWSMGLLIGLDFPVHIMSSMIPVFLMAIATDSIHIFNEFYFRFKEVGDKRQAILDTMAVVGAPVRATDIATAIGFGALALGGIIPVRVFGIFIALGTLAVLVMSFSFIPAVMMLVKERHLTRQVQEEDAEHGSSRRLKGLAEFSLKHSRAVAVWGIVLVAAALVGVSQIRINNNMVNWFKAGSEIRSADAVMNRQLGGTAMAYLVADSETPEAMKDPKTLQAIEGLQRELEKDPLVGKTSSIVDVVRRINVVLHDGDKAFDVIPPDATAVGQYLFLYSSAGKPRDLDVFVDSEAKRSNLFVQLRSWDASAMRGVLARANAYVKAHPIPGVAFKPAGIAYFNLVWNDSVLSDMVVGFGVALVLVLAVLVASFRSLLWGVISYVPLLFTILLIYGVVGFLGKDFDMPISVLSTLSLGMAVDFAIHFVNRFRQRLKVEPDVHDALIWTAARPGKGIMRNAVLFSAAFIAMAFASLTPYIVVGLFIMSLMLLSGFLTVAYLPALIWLFRSRLVTPAPDGGIAKGAVTADA